MRALKLNTKDKADLRTFRGLVGKKTININEVRTWAQGVTNPIVCKTDSIKVNANGGLSVRNMTEVLALTYKDERTKVLGVEKPTVRKGRKAKKEQEQELDPEAIKFAKMYMEILKGRK